MKLACFIDDGQSKIDSADFSYRHLRKREAENSRMPEWAWNVLWYALGVLTALTLPTSIPELIQLFLN